MRHRYAGRQLSRNSSHRQALLRNLSINLCRERSMRTTVAKAKELRRFLEPLITRSRVDTLHNKRVVLSRLGGNRKAMRYLFRKIGPSFVGRPGGYIRILKCGHRAGDCAPMAIVQLVGLVELEEVE